MSGSMEQINMNEHVKLFEKFRDHHVEAQTKLMRLTGLVKTQNADFIDEAINQHQIAIDNWERAIALLKQLRP